MTEEVKKHLYSIIITFVLKYGSTYRKHYAELADYWDGPLYDEGYFVSPQSLKKLSAKEMKSLMNRVHNIKFHPVYTRDFFQGVIDAGTCREDKGMFSRIIFRNKLLRDFLDSDVHGFNIEFDNLKNKSRTKIIHLLCLPCEGDLDLYLAGALTASVPIMLNGELLFRVKNTCRPNFKRLNINFIEHEKYIYLSPFYILLFSGEIPEEIYFYFLKRINECKIKQLRQGCIDALIHWRYLYKTKPMIKNAFPLLQTPVIYNVHLSIKNNQFDKQVKEERKDFVDERVAKRCKRWYIMSET